MSRFTRALVVSPLADGKTWVLVEPFAYDVGELGSGDTIEVRRGFMTDFASIPRLFWIALPKWGKYGNAAVISTTGSISVRSGVGRRLIGSCWRRWGCCPFRAGSSCPFSMRSAGSAGSLGHEISGIGKPVTAG